MDISVIISELRQERERVDKAIRALESLANSTQQVAAVGKVTTKKGVRKGRPWSPEHRRKFLASMAKRRKAIGQ